MTHGTAVRPGATIPTSSSSSSSSSFSSSSGCGGGAFNVTRSSNPLRAWRGAKIVLGNDSDYRVSHWVVHEDKVGTTAVKRRVFRNIEDHLNDGGSDIIGGKVNAKRGWNMINAEHALDGEYFVLRDERLKGDTPGVTKVRFPKGSRQLRVYSYAWFEKEKEWRVIRDKVCKNGRRGKTYTLTCQNDTVEPFELRPLPPSN